MVKGQQAKRVFFDCLKMHVCASDDLYLNLVKVITCKSIQSSSSENGKRSSIPLFPGKGRQ